MFVPTWILRVLVSAPFIAFSAWHSFKMTSELDNVKGKGWYRFVAFTFWTRTVLFVLFDPVGLGLFPFPE